MQVNICKAKLYWKHVTSGNNLFSRKIENFPFWGPWALTFNIFFKNCFDTMHLTLETCYFRERKNFKQNSKFENLRFTLGGLAPAILSRFHLFLKMYNKIHNGTKLPILAQIGWAVLSIIATKHFKNYLFFYPCDRPF